MLTPAVFQSCGNAGGEDDEVEMRCTFIFGSFPMTTESSQNPLLVVDHDDKEVFVDERLHIVYPKSSMVVDGTGRRVAGRNALRPQREDGWPF